MTPGLKQVAGFKYLLCGNLAKRNSLADQCIYYLGMQQMADDMQAALVRFDCPVVLVCINDWDNDLTPWPAKGLYPGDPDFKGDAPKTLDALTEVVIPTIERAEGLSPSVRAIAGYSLAGLFSVYAFANSTVFEHVASMSGSFWYEGWIDYLQGLHLDKSGASAYFSLGDKESRARERILHSVQANTDRTAEILESWGVSVQNRLVPGSHFDNVTNRILAGLAALTDM